MRPVLELRPNVERTLAVIEALNKAGAPGSPQLWPGSRKKVEELVQSIGSSSRAGNAALQKCMA